MFMISYNEQHDGCKNLGVTKISTSSCACKNDNNSRAHEAIGKKMHTYFSFFYLMVILVSKALKSSI